MPLRLFRDKLTEESIAVLIGKAKGLLSDIKQEDKDSFLSILQLRINDFRKELKKDLSSSEKDLILEQYHKFAKTLHQCLSRPSGTNNYIYSYHRNFYYPVGVVDTIKPNPMIHNLSVGAASLGAFLFFASLPAFVFHPMVGFAMLALAITLLLPSAFALLLPDSPDTTIVKNAEKDIFQEGARLLKPDLTFEQSNAEQVGTDRPQFNN